MGEKTIAEEHFESAEALMAALDPASSRWRTGPPGPWVYRGQGQTWPLVPKVLRPKEDGRPGWECPGIDPISHEDGTPDIERMRRQGEMLIVRRFRDLADESSLPIPDDASKLRSWRHFERIVGATAAGAFGGGLDLDPPLRWPQPELFGLVALAQHYSVPTRLLDWSRKARVAAYFAASDVRKNEAKFNGNLVVWALNLAVIHYNWAKGEQDPDVEVIRAPQASNPNLAAQAGLFTVARHVHDDDRCFSEVIAEGCKRSVFNLTTAMWKLTLPVSEARELMCRLRYEDVHAASVFPGFAGVAESMTEELWLMRAIEQPAKRWFVMGKQDRKADDP